MTDWPDGYLITVAYQLVRRLEPRDCVIQPVP
jgi:hypothetical protein